ncbi:MAG: hypothetical protein KC492_07220 [Myxococcales bacterium]|nr:hypothetical protein [Myxococcales bacterium]
MASTDDSEASEFALQSVFAFSILQQKKIGQNDFVQPKGGLVKLTSKLEELVHAVFGQVQSNKLASVDFDFAGSPTHPLRDGLMSVAFGAPSVRQRAAEGIASRLSSRMDNRSRAGLLLATVEADEPARRVSLLLLPREDVMQPNSARDVEAELLREAFASKSSLRKFARASGHHSPTQFRSADVFDKQHTGDRDSADYWVRDFLLARARIGPMSGSRLLSNCLRRALDAAVGDEREAVIGAMLKARSGLVKKTSLTAYAVAEVPENLHEPYFRGIPPEARRTAFMLNKGVVREQLGRRIFEAEDGVIVSAPTDAVGKTVHIEQQGQTRTLRYSGVISKERVKNSGQK